MKKTWIIVALAALVMISCATTPIQFGNVFTTGSGQVKSEDRPVSGFDSIQLYGSGDVIITQGDSESLTIEAEDNLLPLLTSTVQNNTLVLSTKSGASIVPSKPIRYHVTLKNFKAATLTGSGNISSDKLSGSAVSFSLPGSGNIRVSNLTATSLDATLAGSGTFDLSGVVDTQTARILGSGEFQGKDLHGKVVTIHIAGSGNATVWADDSLSASISGSGDIAYYGSPKLSSSIAGSGNVRSLGVHP